MKKMLTGKESARWAWQTEKREKERKAEVWGLEEKGFPGEKGAVTCSGATGAERRRDEKMQKKQDSYD